MSFGQGYMNFAMQGLKAQVHSPVQPAYEVDRSQVPGVNELISFHQAQPKFTFNDGSNTVIEPALPNIPGTSTIVVTQYQNQNMVLPKPKDYSQTSFDYSIPKVVTEDEPKKKKRSRKPSDRPAPKRSTLKYAAHIKRNPALGLKQFKCEWCEFCTKRRTHLESHIETIHLKIKKFGCNLCEFRTNAKSNLDKHILKVHLKSQDYACKLCNFKTWANHDLVRHTNTVHLKIKKLHCVLCEFKTNETSKLKLHFNRVHLKEKRFKSKLCCEKCDFKTTSKWEFNKHVRNNVCEVGKHACDICEFEAPSKDVLKSHIEETHMISKATKHKCEKCDFEANTVTRLRAHDRSVHLGIKPKAPSKGSKSKRYTCSRPIKCSFACTSEATLKRHVDTCHVQTINKITKVLRNGEVTALEENVDEPEVVVHVGSDPVVEVSSALEWPAIPAMSTIDADPAIGQNSLPPNFQIPEVGKTDVNPLGGLVQAKTETPAPPVEPEKIGGTYAMEKVLELGRGGRRKGSGSAATGGKNFACESCEFTTYYEAVMVRHMRNIHSKIMEFSCSECDFKANDRAELKAHADKHGRGTYYYCDQCDFKTTNGNYLNRHWRCVHLKEKNYSCNSCEYKAFDKSTLDRHVYNHHVNKKT